MWRRRRGTPLPVNPFLGSATRIVIERIARGEFDDVDAVGIVEDIRATVGNLGQVSRLSRQITWQTMQYAGAPGRQVYVSLAPADGMTRIRIEENLRPLAGQYFGGLMGGLGGGTMGVWMGIGMGVLHSPVAAIGLAATALSGTYTLARTLFRKANAKRSAELTALADRIVTVLESPPKRLRSR